MENIYHEHKGRKVVRVTACLPFSPPPGMSEAALDIARDRGQTVHEITAMDDSALLDDDSVDVDLAGFLRGWRDATIHMKWIWYAVEQKVYSKLYDYMGTLDRLGCIGSQLTLVDIKTGPIYPTAGLQLAAYEQASRERWPKFVGKKKVDRLTCRLFDNGVWNITRHDDPEDWYEYLAKLRSLKWDLSHGYKVEG